MVGNHDLSPLQGFAAVTVYVDQLFTTRQTRQWPYKSACHLTADSTEELLAFAQQIGLRADWLQKPGQWHEHFDLTEGKRAEAVRLGAVEETWRESVSRLQQKRPAP